ncbi:Testis-expressed protein 13B [Galemys pyrenaicus]|uniref:Testis-expressed protein 13B n=1 Tax=Galemys pyrenaicus TaxID=202257 RepID=A0A8J5ZSH3_GALPY|nr:Testis-expressed protein 13B [Galemys pyrenaicus]
MALKPEDSCGGFRHSKVMEFINEKIAGHVNGPEFYHTNAFLSWEEVEDKLKAILEDSEVPSEAKEACAWSSLALGMRFAYRQSQLHARRVQWLQDFAKLHKSAAQSLATDLKELTTQQEMERKEAALRLRQTQANLAEMRKERDLLRWKLLRAELESPPEWAAEGPRVATVRRMRSEGAGEKEESAGAAVATPPTAGESSAALEETGERPEDEEEGAKTSKELGRSVVQLLGNLKHWYGPEKPHTSVPLLGHPGEWPVLALGLSPQVLHTYTLPTHFPQTVLPGLTLSSRQNILACPRGWLVDHRVFLPRGTHADPRIVVSAMCHGLVGWNMQFIKMQYVLLLSELSCKGCDNSVNVAPCDLQLSLAPLFSFRSLILFEDTEGQEMGQDRLSFFHPQVVLFLPGANSCSKVNDARPIQAYVHMNYSSYSTMPQASADHPQEAWKPDKLPIDPSCRFQA